jgi:predicted lysophospholipase L1 biosynthesis ABC-type transport system permease subunit
VIALEPSGATGVSVIGVVPDVLNPGTEAGRREELFLAFWQFSGDVRSPTLLLRTREPASRGSQAIRTALLDRVDARADITVITLEDALRDATRPQRTAVALLTVCTLLVLVIVGVGLHGVVSHTVARSRHELAIRAALGASPLRVVGTAARTATAQVLLGAGLGFGSIVVWNGFLGSAVGRELAMSVGAVAFAVLVIALVSFAAAAAPLARVWRMSPAAILRSE